MYVIILKARNPKENNPYIAVTQDAQTSASIPTHGKSRVNNYCGPTDPQRYSHDRGEKKHESLQVACECYASAQQAAFQNGFPGVTKPEGSLPS